ncbi:MAG: hypothetical protein PHS49_00295 [Candidatus Gracilibacteria bacterium]|nr:hypothetical protein [Candidatus Gracilibacteria bacterium]
MSNTTVNDLFGSAADEGLLSQDSQSAIEFADIGEEINAALGINADDFGSSEVVLVTMLIDDSGSIQGSNNVDVVINGHNLVIESLQSTKQAQSDSILAHTRYLNGKVLFPYQSINQAVKMDHSNYNHFGGTPLYDQSAVVLATVIAKCQEFSDNGIACRSVTLIVTDGADCHSNKFRTAKSISPLVRDLLRQENHIVAAMGIDDGGYTDFNSVFTEMGIPDSWILTPANTDSEIRAAFNMFSQSATQASQSAQAFSQAAMGGFGN